MHKDRTLRFSECVYLKWKQEEFQRSVVVPCTLHWASLDVAGDKVRKEQKQTTQQKQEDIDKRRCTGLIIQNLREFSSKMPPRYLAEPSSPIRPEDVLLLVL